MGAESATLVLDVHTYVSQDEVLQMLIPCRMHILDQKLHV